MKKENAMYFLIIDLLKNILSLAERPDKLGRYITSQIRELIGSRMVILLQHLEKAEGSDHVVVGMCPERQIEISEFLLLKDIAEISHLYHSAKIVHHRENGTELEHTFYKLGGNSSIIVPLEYGSNRIGLIILFDLMDLQNIDSVIESLSTLSGVLALELHNAMYYNNLEQKVAERTKELRESEENWKTLGFALKKKAEELERFNNLMLGREMKMMELKKEINEMLKKAGQNEKYKIHE